MVESIPLTWEEVARVYGRKIYNFAYRLTGNADDAHDLVQEVLLRVRRGLANYQPGSFEGWLWRITRNAFLDEIRKRKRRPTSPLPDEIDQSGGRMSRQMTTLMNKLMRVSETRPTLAAGLKDILAKWGMSQDALGNRQDDDVKSAMKEVLQRRGDDDSNPAPYQNLLDGLAQVQLPHSGIPSDTRYRDPEDEDEPITPTRKIKRELIYERFKDLVESMYSDREERLVASEVGDLLS